MFLYYKFKRSYIKRVYDNWLKFIPTDGLGWAVNCMAQIKRKNLCELKQKDFELAEKYYNKMLHLR